MRKSIGDSLIEVLIALCILSIGLLAFAKLQWHGLQNAGNQWSQTVALNQQMNLAEQLRTRPKKKSLSQIYQLWQQINKQQLSQAQSELQVDEQHYHFSIAWYQRDALKQSIQLQVDNG